MNIRAGALCSEAENGPHLEIDNKKKKRKRKKKKKKKPKPPGRMGQGVGQIREKREMNFSTHPGRGEMHLRTFRTGRGALNESRQRGKKGDLDHAETHETP